MSIPQRYLSLLTFSSFSRHIHPCVPSCPALTLDTLHSSYLRREGRFLQPQHTPFIFIFLFFLPIHTLVQNLKTISPSPAQTPPYTTPSSPVPVPPFTGSGPNPAHAPSLLPKLSPSTASPIQKPSALVERFVPFPWRKNTRAEFTFYNFYFHFFFTLAHSKKYRLKKSIYTVCNVNCIFFLCTTSLEFPNQNYCKQFFLSQLFLNLVTMTSCWQCHN